MLRTLMRRMFMSEQALSIAAWAVVAATISGDVTPRCGVEKPARTRSNQTTPGPRRDDRMVGRMDRHGTERAGHESQVDLGRQVTKKKRNEDH